MGNAVIRAALFVRSFVRSFVEYICCHGIIIRIREFVFAQRNAKWSYLTPVLLGLNGIDYFDGSMLFVTCSQLGIVCVCVLVRRL
jgi:hypothetical protein